MTPADTLPDSEATPLARSRFGSYGDRDSVATDDSASKYAPSVAERIVKFSKTRFWWFCGLGVVAIVVLQLSFLPRTSLSRDYRRWNGLKMTKNDVKRTFLWHSGLDANADRIHGLLGNFSVGDFALVGDDAPQAAAAVQAAFGELGFETTAATGHFAALGRPVAAQLRLVDPKKDAVVYEADLREPGTATPAFLGLGAAGSVTSDFVYANDGLWADYAALGAAKIAVAGRVVIVRSAPDAPVSVAEKLALAQSFGAAAFVHYFDYAGLVSNNRQSEAYLQNVVRRECAAVDGGDLDSLKLPTIPAIPASFKALKPILDTLAVASNKPFHSWSYYPENRASGLKLKVRARFDPEAPRQFTNIVGTLDGIIKDGAVVIGAPRDSASAGNPLSSQVVLLEIMRHFQTLVKGGWKPLRTIKFVSWDASRNGLVGSKSFLADPAFSSNVLAYINIDADAVRGSTFKVDAHPLLNHLVRKVARSVPMPKDSIPYKTLATDDDDDDDVTTLFHYWKKQDNATINNDLGRDVCRTDAATFQYHLSTPIVNVKFDNDPKRDASVYTPNSNYFSLRWLVKRQIDDSYVLHSSLVQYLGMLLISLSEHEVVAFRAADYFDKVHAAFEAFLADNKDKIAEWSSKEVSKYLLKSSLAGDLSDDTIEFGMIVQLLRKLVARTTKSATVFDIYNTYLQEGLIQDFPWYQSFKKLKIWAQFKISNYKLLHLEKDLALKESELAELSDTPWYNHLIYSAPVMDLQTNRLSKPLFNNLYDALHQNNLELSVKWIGVVYEKLKNLDKKMA